MNSSICGCGSKGNSFLNDPPLIKDSNFNLVFQPIEFEIVLVDIAIVKKSPDQIDSAILLLKMAALRQGTTYAKAKNFGQSGLSSFGFWLNYWFVQKSNMSEGYYLSHEGVVTFVILDF